MTIIKINGGFWGWEPIETLERLYPLFEQYTLDPIYQKSVRLIRAAR